MKRSQDHPFFTFIHTYHFCVGMMLLLFCSVCRADQVQTFWKKLLEANRLRPAELKIDRTTADIPGVEITFAGRGLDRQPLLIQSRRKACLYCGRQTELTQNIPAGLKVIRTDKDVTLITGPDQQAVISAGTSGIQHLSSVERLQMGVPSGSSASLVRPRVERAAPLRIHDSFMRTDLFADSPWRSTSGSWGLLKFGGGLPEPGKEEDYTVQRAVNPFAVTGKGILSFVRLKNRSLSEQALGPNLRFEASFYFGVPWKKAAVDRTTLPTDHSFLLAAGVPKQNLLAWGWYGKARRFCLLEQKSDGEWRQVGTVFDKRPPITNWVKLELRLLCSTIVEGWIDGVKVCEHTLDSPLKGTFHVIAPGKKVEFDDVTIETLPVPPSEKIGDPLYVKSRNFAGKKEKPQSDPIEFRQWAKGSNTFLKVVGRTEDKRFVKTMLLPRTPMFNDFHYRVNPNPGEKKQMPYGRYQFELLPANAELPIYSRMKPLLRLRFIYDARGWHAAPETEKAYPPLKQFR
ncbi:MAG: hypothetical protein D6820_10685, partial [Lentisphaerae bacterium]